MTSPERIWVDWKRANAADAAYDEPPQSEYQDCRDEYILHTRAALAASPLVQEIVAEAVNGPTWQRPDAAENKRRRAICDDHAQMLDAQSQCVHCKLCGGKAVIGDAGPGWGYYIECENAARYTRQTCTQTGVRISGWAYNVSDMWNRLNAAAIRARGEGQPQEKGE